MIRMYATLALFALVACGSDPGTKYDYSKCDGPTAIVVTNQDVLDEDGSLALPKGVETDIGLKVTDAEGDLCDPHDLTLELDATQIEVVSLYEDVILKPLADAIDAGSEPMTAVHAEIGDLTLSMTVVSVVALGGTWNVTVSEATRYPDGFDFGEVTFTQLGRRMVWEDCTIPLVCTRDGIIRGHEFTVDAPDVGLTLSAPIAHDRRSFSGPWATADMKYSGAFTAERVD